MASPSPSFLDTPLSSMAQAIGPPSKTDIEGFRTTLDDIVVRTSVE
jgi:hypothetical protein